MQSLQQNDISVEEFRSAVKELLHKGLGKSQNIFIIEPANCGKTFFLKLISLVYSSFVNPATSTFAWVAAGQAEFPGMMLLLPEGQSVDLPAPKNYYAQDILLTSDRPINMVSRDTETEMMKVQWKVFKFHHRISET